jgi:aminopeptidase N/puromycin-sensitive aminopeptidase
VLGAVTSGINTTANRIASTAKERDELDAWERQVYGPVYAKLGAPSASDSQETRELRASLLGLLGFANDPKVIADAKQITQKHLADPASVDPTLAGPALYVAAYHGDATLFDQLQKTYETGKDPILQESALRALSLFKDPALEKRALDYATSSKVRNQDAVISFIIPMQSSLETRDLAWQFIQDNWPKVQAQLTTATGGALVGATASFCSAEKRDEVASFFAAHKVPASERALKQAQNRIDACIDLRAEQEPRLKDWLAAQHLNTTTSSGN